MFNELTGLSAKQNSHFLSRFILQTLFFFLLVTQISFAQWVWYNPIPQGNALYGVHFLDDNVGWAVGNKGTILKTTDGGINWYAKSSNTHAKIRAVQFLNPNLGYCVGDSGLVLKTTNGGNNWIKLNCGYNYLISSLHLINENIGWIGAGNNIIKTTNGGNSWQSFVQFAPFSIHSVFFLNESIGFWAGFGGVNKTTDGGANFSSHSGLPYSYDWDDIFFINDNVGWIVGEDGKVIKTTDCGANWVQKSSVSGYYDRIFFKDNIHGWIASGWDGLYRTEDGGDSWSLTSIKNMYDVFFTSNVGFAVGEGGKIYKSTDLGVSWYPSYLNQMENKKFSDIFFNDPEVGFAVGDSGKIFKTSNGGVTWFPQSCPTNTNLSSVLFTDVNTGWISGHQIILKTTDSGNSWKLKYTSLYENINDVYFLNSQLGWAAGSKILKTDNGGNTWSNQTIQNVGGDYYITSVYFIDENTGFCTSRHNYLFYKTTNGGSTWKSATVPTSVELYSVEFIDSNTGWIVGAQGTILKTTDGGTNWEIQNFGQSYALYGLHIIDSLNIWAVGGTSNSDYGSYTLLTTNGGDIWHKVENPNTQCLSNTYFIDANKGWAVGEQGAMMNYADNILIPQTPSNLLVTSLDDRIKLEWSDNSTDEILFEIFRSDNYSGNYRKIAEVDSNIEEYIDSSMSKLAVFWYRIRARNSNGVSGFCQEDSAQTYVVSSIEGVDLTVPISYNLKQNYPNPFNPTTKISWQSPVSSRQILKVYDVLGNGVATLVNEEKEAGYHSIDFDASNLTSGVYFYQLRAGEFVSTKKMILLR
jgi:photosystem II stability/assembly factor-like uncharacterized protein